MFDVGWGEEEEDDEEENWDAGWGEEEKNLENGRFFWIFGFFCLF